MRKTMLLKNTQFLRWTVMLCTFFTMSTTVLKAKSEDRVISGTVTDKESGLPVHAVTITSKKSDTATSTLQNGSFTMQLKSGNDTLEISIVGYYTRYIYAGNPGSLNIKLEKDFNKLDEVVVIGYGASKKRNVVGATDVIKVRMPEQPYQPILHDY